MIAITNGYDLVYQWFDYLKTKGHLVTGYVVMPDHLHALIYFSKTDKPINKIVGDTKRFMAYETIKRLKDKGREGLLIHLRNAVEATDRQRGKKHEVWEDSIDSKICRTEKSMNQKLAYMHANPCSGKWKLAARPIDYEHSPARFYISSGHAAYKVTAFDEVLKLVLNRAAETTAKAQGNE